MLNPINDPFVLTLYSPFLTEMRITLGTLDTLSRVYRPSQAVYQSVFPKVGVSRMFAKGQCYIVVYLDPERPNVATTTYAMQSHPYNNDRLPQRSTGSSLPPEGLWPIHHNSSFAELQSGTVRKSLSPSCRSTFNRQGTTLP